MHGYNHINFILHSRHFRPKLVHSNESVYCTPIDRKKAIKKAIQRGVGQLSTTNHSWVMKVFVKSVVLFFGKNKYTNIRRFWTIFCHKTRIFSLQKAQKNTLLSKIGIQQIFKQKLKVGNFHCLHSNINIVQNFGHLQNKCVIYRPGIYNLQTRTVTFPDR